MAKSKSIELAGEIVTSFVSNNSVPRSDLPALIEAVHAAVKSLAERGEIAAPAVETPEPAVPIRKSITPDYLICLEDGKKFKSLRRHLTTLGMTPEQYREKWNLPSTYPMVAPNYAAQRSALAKNIGLGQSRGRALAAPDEMDAEDALEARSPEPEGEDALEARSPEPEGDEEIEAARDAPPDLETEDEIAAEPASVAEIEETAPPAPPKAEAAAPEAVNDHEIEAEPSAPASAPRRKPRSKSKAEATDDPPVDGAERKRGRPRKSST